MPALFQGRSCGKFRQIKKPVEPSAGFFISL